MRNKANVINTIPPTTDYPFGRKMIYEIKRDVVTIFDTGSQEFY